MFILPLLYALLSVSLGVFVQASPVSPLAHGVDLSRRTTEPYFPDTPPSCPICEKNYGNIQNCAEAAPVLANFSMIIFNPGAFINVIQCSCTETFQSVFPQCVDCFVRTNQTEVLEAPSLPDVVQGMRKICALQSTLLGGVASANGEIPSVTTAAPVPTETNSDIRVKPGLVLTVVVAALACDLLLW
ncbi:hypothetical protein Moror_14549 [Moniliophthora roreri MCA 2997]|uniref:Uncharacterized protein n=2 Tax=Moniliophthora roreri TaxID=221103 RepID=V2XKB3_MONRO|nr:hypothetical protein Moror_14549 [Moniliophthora roreri MCA 2997]KAI3604148.1 hypothetical protein WG66_010126 [Moniliophthora roreri]